MDVLLLLLACLASFARMLASYIISLLIAIFVGILMARKRGAETLLMPILDILQSIPILGFFPVAILAFLTFLPRNIGLEFAAVFLITTSLLWNMIFGVYSSIKSLDPNVFTMAEVYNLKAFSRLTYIYVPAARASIAANSIISWAGGWFFLTSAEVLSSGSEGFKLFGIGSLIMDLYGSNRVPELNIAIATLFTTIMASYIMVFNPATNIALQRYMLLGCSRVFHYIHKFITAVWEYLVGLGIKLEVKGPHSFIAAFTAAYITLQPTNVIAIQTTVGYAFITEFLVNFMLSLSRVALVVLSSLALTVGIAYISLIKGWGSIIALMGEALASIPAILWWPILSPFIDVLPWLISYVIFLQGSIWYLFFNVMLFGVPKVRNEVLELARVYGIKGLNYFRYILIPSLMPSIAAGALSAWGGAWNASIVAEYFESGANVVDLGGVGSMLSKFTYGGDYGSVIHTVLLWALMIVTLNKVIWSRVFRLVERTFVVE